MSTIGGGRLALLTSATTTTFGRSGVIAARMECCRELVCTWSSPGGGVEARTNPGLTPLACLGLMTRNGEVDAAGPGGASASCGIP
jgi:hypothetical protein